MADAAQPTPHEFWRPPIDAVTDESAAHVETTDACSRCGAEFIVSSRFCHACGASRPGSRQRTRNWQVTVVGVVAGVTRTFAGTGERLGLPTAAFVAFLAGVACVLGALGVGLVFSVRTVLDWQAIQMWRIEWLLGAVAMFSAGCLLRRTR